MDEETREFNFWTHQIHIFFLRKLFPAYEHMLEMHSGRERLLIEKEVGATVYQQYFDCLTLKLNHLAYLNFGVLSLICFKMCALFIKSVDNFEVAQNKHDF